MIRVIHTPNTGPALEQVWAFVSRDGAGRENVIAGNLGSLGMTALVTGNPRNFEIYRQIVQESRADLESAGQTIHLLRFTRREEIGGW